MSKYIQIGSVAVAIEDIRNLPVQSKFAIIDFMFDGGFEHNLSLQEKFAILEQMFKGVGIEQDNQGQIVLYTDMMKDSDGNVVPFAVNPSEEDGAEPDPYEAEEEEVHSGELFSENDELPPTLRDPSVAPNSQAA